MRRVSIGNECNGVRAIRITSGGRSTGYYLKPATSDYGRSYQLDKFGVDAGSDSSERSYNVLLDGQQATCTCKGYQRFGRCKHGDALKALFASGKLG
jgi:hypothetical protein